MEGYPFQLFHEDTKLGMSTLRYIGDDVVRLQGYIHETNFLKLYSLCYSKTTGDTVAAKLTGPFIELNVNRADIYLIKGIDLPRTHDLIIYIKAKDIVLSNNRQGAYRKFITIEGHCSLVKAKN